MPRPPGAFHDRPTSLPRTHSLGSGRGGNTPLERFCGNRYSTAPCTDAPLLTLTLTKRDLQLQCANSFIIGIRQSVNQHFNTPLHEVIASIHLSHLQVNLLPLPEVSSSLVVLQMIRFCRRESWRPRGRHLGGVGVGRGGGF